MLRKHTSRNAAALVWHSVCLVLTVILEVHCYLLADHTPDRTALLQQQRGHAVLQPLTCNSVVVSARPSATAAFASPLYSTLANPAAA
jgi:hypothetical protein